MKIAYIILAHKNPKQLARMLLGLNGVDTNFFIHVDSEVPIGPFQQALANTSIKPILIPTRQNVLWGGYSMVQATLDTIRAAKASSHHDYYILLSGSDYPIKSHADLLTELQSGGYEYINRHKMPADHVGKPISRLEHPYRATKNPKRPQNRAVNALLRLLPKLNYREVLGQLEPHGGSQWWCLSQGCIDYILDFIESHSDLVKFFNRVKIPDEIMFHTILSHSPFEEKIKPALMYTAWTPGGVSPRVLGPNCLHQLKESGKYFARKFDLHSDADIFDIIDARLRR
jgi:hypothetical protein